MRSAVLRRNLQSLAISGVLAMGFAVPLILAACGGSQINLSEGSTSLESVGASGGETGLASNGNGADSGAGETVKASTSPRLGFVENKNLVSMENGGRVPVDDEKVAEIFLSPYPPDWQTDLHLFLLDNETFKPITDTEVLLDYDMVYMNHGIASALGSKVADGHYMVPLDFLMYGDWNVEIRLDLPEGKKQLDLVVVFQP